MINSDLYERKMSTEIKTSVLIFCLERILLMLMRVCPSQKRKSPPKAGFCLRLDLNGIVGSFLGDVNIVGVALLETCARDPDELSLFVECRDILAAAKSHT